MNEAPLINWTITIDYAYTLNNAYLTDSKFASAISEPVVTPANISTCDSTSNRINFTDTSLDDGAITVTYQTRATEAELLAGVSSNGAEFTNDGTPMPPAI